MDDFAEFRHFKFLLAVAENKGFRAAAEALHTAQPSLSRQVREFQEHYHLALFRKIRGKGIVLTPAGEALLVVARTVLEVRDDAIAALAAIQNGEAEVFRIGCSPFVDKTICKAAADTYHKLLPAAEFRSSSSDNHALLHQLSAGRLDAAIVSLPVHDETLRVELLKQESLVACLPAAHPLAQKAALSGSDLTANLKVFRDPFQHPEAHERLIELLMELGVKFDDHSHTSHPHEMQEAVLNGSGFALLREGTPLISGLITRPIIGVDWTFDTAFVYRPNGSRILPILARALHRQFTSNKVPSVRKKPAGKVSSTSCQQRQAELFA